MVVDRSNVMTPQTMKNSRIVIRGRNKNVLLITNYNFADRDHANYLARTSTNPTTGQTAIAETFESNLQDLRKIKNIYKKQIS